MGLLEGFFFYCYVSICLMKLQLSSSGQIVHAEHTGPVVVGSASRCCSSKIVFSLLYSLL